MGVLSTATAWFALLLAAPAPSGGAPERTAPPTRAIVVDDAVTLVVPAAMADEVTSPHDGAHLLTETVGAATLTLVVYTGKRPPRAATALEVHADELEKTTSAGRRARALKLPFLGASRAARELTYTARGEPQVARLVAHRGKGWTVVLTTSAPARDAAAAAEVARRMALIEVR